jgi:hypothetical protein
MNKLIKKLQAISLDEEFLLTRGISKTNIKKPIELQNILFRKRDRFIGYTTTPSNLPFELNHKIDGIDGYAFKEVFVKIGVLLLELLFSKQVYLEFKINHPQSEIKQLFFYLNKEFKNKYSSFLKIEQPETYDSFEYFAQRVDKFPFSKLPNNTREVLKEALPNFYLGSSEDPYLHSEEYIKKADQLITVLSVDGLVQLAELFLDIGNSNNTQTEICLENPLYGFGGTDQRSIEIRFWLPDSFGFYTNDINTLKF